MNFIFWFAEKMNDMPSALWAVVGTIVGALATGVYAHFNNIRLKHIEYTNAFFQKLTDERFALYKEIQEAVWPFTKIDTFGNKVYLVLLCNPEEFRGAAKKIAGLNLKRRWLSEKSSACLSEFSKSLITVHLEVLALGEKPKEVDLILLGAKHQQSVEDLYTRLLDAIHEEMFDLHDIKAFRSKIFQSK